MTKIEIPPLEEFIVYEKFYGVLFGDKNILKYYSREDNKVYELARASSSIWSILADVKGEVYFGTYGTNNVHSLFNGFKLSKNGYVCSMVRYKDKILDTGEYGLEKTLSSEVLISVNDMEKRNIKEIENLFTNKNHNLYALVWNKNETFSIITLPKNYRKYSLGEEILHYDVRHLSICQAIAVPGELKGLNGKTYPFSIISCVNLKYLDINGKKVKRSGVGKGMEIKNLSYLSPSLNKIELIYAGVNLNEIIKVEIEDGKVKNKKTLIPGLSNYVLTLEPVFNKNLHKKLVAKGRGK